MAEKTGIAAKTTKPIGKESTAKKPKANLSQSETLTNDTSVEQLLFLQRTFGNRTVTGFMQHRIQAKPKIGKANDKYEQAADRMADRVMKMDEGSLVNGHSSLVQRQEEKEEKVQTKSTGPKSGKKTQPTASSRFESRLSSTKGGGQSLPDDTRQFMETRFDADFSNVRVHTGSDAAQMNNEIDAKAFTSGRDIYFGPGKYNTGTTAGKHLLAHELTHTIQQGGAVRSKANGVTASTPDIQRSPGPLSSLLNRIARNIPGFTLITVILGKNPITDEPVPCTAENMLGAFLGMIPGGAALFNKLKTSGALAEAFTWLKRQIRILNITWTGVKALIARAWEMCSITKGFIGNMEILESVFGPPLRRIKNFAAAIAAKAKEFVLRGVLKLVGAPVNTIMRIINRGRAILGKILSNPIGFARNLLRAVKTGFGLFAGNFVKHLKASISSWLFGTLSGAGIQVPETFDLKGIFSLVTQILGLTYRNIRARIVRRLGPRGEQIVSGIERTVAFVRELVTRGPIALWEKAKEQLTNLKEMVFGAIIGWVKNTIIQKAVVKIISMFNPAGALVQAAMAIYDVIMFFINRWEQIKALAQAVINAITPIVYGRVTRAAQWVEKVMARGLTVIISFLARLVGLGGISNKIREIIKKIRRPIDRAVDKVIGWIVRKGRALFRRGRAAVRRGVEKVKAFFSIGFMMKRKRHKLEISKRGSRLRVLMASSELRPLGDRVDNALKKTTDPEVKTGLNDLKQKTEKLENDLRGGLKQKSFKTRLKFLKGTIEAFGAKHDLEDIMPAANLEDEGKVGSYSSLRGKEDLTPDHQPQTALLLKLKKVKFSFKNKTIKRKLFSETNTKIGNYTSAKGITMNMHVSRHMDTRTFKSGGSTALATSLGHMGADSDLVITTTARTEEGGRQQAIPKVKSAVSKALEDDRTWIKDIYNNPKWKLPDKVKKRAINAEGEVKSKNKEAWPEVFE
jgi:hypothetical protein